MSTVDSSPSAVIEAIRNFGDLDRLPSVPAAALQILQKIQTSDMSIAELAQTVEQDPALTARILKLVNSSLFGLPGKIVSPHQAIVVLGLRTIEVLTLSFLTVEGFGQNRLDWFDYRSYWRRSLTQAVAARLLAKAAAPQLRDAAFVAGLLSDLGILVMTQALPVEYERLYRQSQGDHARLLEAEHHQLGMGHPEIARMLMGTWSLPEEICTAVALHHAADADGRPEPSGRLADIVWLAARVADLFCQPPMPERLDTLHQLAQARLSLDSVRFGQMLADLDQRVHESAELLNVDIGQTVAHDQLRSQAALRLAELSVQGAIQGVQAQQREDSFQQRQAELTKAALTDGLSGLANRPAFDQHIQDLMAAPDRGDRPIGLIMCDLDHFKRVNDTYGHPVGDQVIAATGRLLQEYQDTRTFVARYGGEEFALLLDGCDWQQLADVSQQICQRFQAASVPCSQGLVRFPASLGAATTEGLSKSCAQDLIILADRYLYRAKRSGRGRACIVPRPKAFVQP